MQSWESELILLNQKNARPHIKPSVICQTEAAIRIMFKYDFTPIIPRENYMLPIKQFTHRLKLRGRGRQSQFEIKQSSTDFSNSICNWRGGVSQREFIAYVLMSWLQWQISLFHHVAHLTRSAVFSELQDLIGENLLQEEKYILSRCTDTKYSLTRKNTVLVCIFKNWLYFRVYMQSWSSLSLSEVYIDLYE